MVSWLIEFFFGGTGTIPVVVPVRIAFVRERLSTAGMTRETLVSAAFRNETLA